MRGDSLAGIGGTGWVKATVLPHERAQTPSIESDDENQYVLHDVSSPACEALWQRRCSCRGRSVVKTRPTACGTWSGQENNVQPRQALGQGAKGFACPAFYAITSRCKANVLLCHGKSQAMVAVVVGTGQEKEVLLPTTPSRTVEHRAVISRTDKPLVFSETVGHRLRCSAGDGDALSIPGVQAVC